MSEPFVGEIRMFAGSFAPLGWAFCNGATLAISQNEVLFALIGTIYGGDGQTTYNLPDMRGRLPIHKGVLGGGSTYTIGQVLGSETVTLTQNQLPAHQHLISANSNLGSSPNPSGNIVAGSSLSPFIQGATQDVSLNPQTIGFAGGSQPHSNLMPSLCITFIIALEGIFPSQN